MSFFADPNKDAMSVTPDQAATGPRVGFLDSFETSYNAQVRASAMFGIEKAFHEQDAAQVEQLRKAGVEDLPHLSDSAFNMFSTDDSFNGFFGTGTYSPDYIAAARFYKDGGDPELGQRLQQYDDKIGEFQKRFPDLQLKTSREMWDTVRSSAQKYDIANETQRRTAGGSVGGFLGGAIGGLNPLSDPLNFATLGVGGAGKTIIGRVAGQAGAQGLIEGVNQITGVQEERRLLDLSTGFADGLSRVAGAAIGGAALQGAGELLDVGFRRFFRNVPHDPAPLDVAAAPDRPKLPDASAVPDGVIPADPAMQAAKLAQRPQTYMDYLQEVSPWSVSRAGKARTVLDIDNVRTQLDDWAGPDPAFTAPKADTAVNLPRNDFVAKQPTIFDKVADQSNIDQLARQVDPDTFRIYDKLADERQAYRDRIAELEGARQKEPDVQLAAVNDRIDALQEKITRAGAMKAKKYGKEMQALIAEREAAKTEILKTDTPDMARMRQKVMQNDERMRDMAPVVSRAYARAQGKWDNTSADREAIRTMLKEGRKTLDQPGPSPDPLASLPQSLYDKAPILQQRASVEASLKPDADAADVASKILETNAKANEGVIEAFRSSVNKIVKDAEDAKAKLVKPEPLKPGEPNPDEVIVPGFKEPIHLDRDKITVPNEDGNGERTLSFRELFEEQARGEEDLKAITSCSIR